MAKKSMTNATPTRTKEIAGYRVQPMLPIGHPYFGIEVQEAEFRMYPSEPGRWYVEAMMKIGTLESPYTTVLSIEQALAADVIERIDDGGCRCSVCNGRTDDPARIHGRR